VEHTLRSWSGDLLLFLAVILILPPGGTLAQQYSGVPTSRSPECAPVSPGALNLPPAPGTDAFGVGHLWSPAPQLAGKNGIPRVNWGATGANGLGTAGPLVRASVSGSVFAGTGSSQASQRDFHLPLNGIDWFHERVYSSTVSSMSTWQGEQWWSNEMMNLTVVGTEGTSNCSVQTSPYETLSFTYNSGSWTCDEGYLYTLTFSAGNNEYTMTRPDGHQWIFHDSETANVGGRLKAIEDPYGNDWAFNYSGSDLDYIDVDVVEGSDHRITYSYFTSGDNNGLLQYIKVYKSTTTTSANLIGQVEYVYHDSTSDNYGSEDDLMKVIVTKKATSDGDGTLSIESTYLYRYFKGTYNAGDQSRHESRAPVRAPAGERPASQ
jgi:hypothetical protein